MRANSFSPLSLSYTLLNSLYIYTYIHIREYTFGRAHAVKETDVKGRIIEHFCKRDEIQCVYVYLYNICLSLCISVHEIDTRL